MSQLRFSTVHGMWARLGNPALWMLASAEGASGEMASLWLTTPAEDSGDLKNNDLQQKIIRLYDALRPPLYRYLINIGVCPEDVEEVVQESFLRLYQHLRHGGDEDNLRGWIYKVAHNLSINVRKDRRREVEITPELWEQLSQSTAVQVPSPEEHLLEEERVRCIHDELSELTQLQRDCLNLRVEGFRYREIGEILNIGTSTVAGSLRNAIVRIVKRRSA